MSCRALPLRLSTARASPTLAASSLVLPPSRNATATTPVEPHLDPPMPRSPNPAGSTGLAMQAWRVWPMTGLSACAKAALQSNDMVWCKNPQTKHGHLCQAFTHAAAFMMQNSW